MEWVVDDFCLLDMLLLLVIDVVVVDYYEGIIMLIVNVVNWNGIDEWVDWVYDDVVVWLDVMIVVFG